MQASRQVRPTPPRTPWRMGTDLLQAARGDKGDPRAVEAAMKAAIEQDDQFVAKMWKTLGKDPARAAWANHLLKDTRYYRGPAKK